MEEYLNKHTLIYVIITKVFITYVADYRYRLITRLLTWINGWVSIGSATRYVDDPIIISNKSRHLELL